MAVYSHSKLSTFEQCRYKYKLKYIDKIPSPVEKSIEAHLGTSVHDALEWLYKEVLKGRVPELDEVLERYTQKWQEDYNENILIVRKELTDKDYYNKGIKFIVDYYTKHKPFNDGTLELEKQVWVRLSETCRHKVIGYIDRLVYNRETGEYEIHDYKTATNLPTKEKIEQDRQLALYSIAIKQLFGQDKNVTLIWHYLNHNTKIISRRTNEQLEELKKQTINLIREIENARDFPPTKSPLCEWCEYKQYCKAWGNDLPEEYKQKQQTLPEDETSKFPTASKYIKTG